MEEGGVWELRWWMGDLRLLVEWWKWVEKK